MLTQNDLAQIRKILEEVLNDRHAFDSNRLYSIQDAEVIRLLGISEDIKHPSVKAIKDLENAGINLCKKRKSGTTVMGSELNRYIELKKRKLYDKN